MIDFPNSPILNETYTFNGLTWQWNGSAWIAVSSGITYATVSQAAAFSIILS
jgi:hypothetical protein